MVVVGSCIRYVPEDNIQEVVFPEIRNLATMIADTVVPTKLSRLGNNNARVLATETMCNALHGENIIFEIDSRQDGTLDLSTRSRKGKDRLVSQYSPEVEAEMPHQGKILIRHIAGKGNHKEEITRNFYDTHTHFVPEDIIAAS